MGFEEQAQGHIDTAAPSESFVGGLLDFDDVSQTTVYSMLPTALRQLDAADQAYFLRRFLQRSDELWARWQQKTWRVARLGAPRHAPDAVLDHLLALVGFGPGSGLPDRVARRLSLADKRKLAAIAVLFWKRRGRRDAISDALRIITGVRPIIDDWFWLRTLIGEALLGVEGGPGVDLWLLYESLTGLVSGEVDGPTQVVFRVPDVDGLLDRQLVRDLIELVRPPRARYEIAFVDFVDTLLDGRLGHWVNPVTPAGEHVPGSSATEPITLPGFKFIESAVDRVETPTSATWSSYTASFLLTIPADNNSWLDFRFYVQPDGDCYSLEMSAPDSMRLMKIVGGVPAALTAAQVDLLGPSTRGVRVDTEVLAGETTIRVYLDGEEVFTRTDNAFMAGTIEFRGIAGTATIHRPEVFQHPLDLVVLTP